MQKKIGDVDKLQAAKQQQTELAISSDTWITIVSQPVPSIASTLKTISDILTHMRAPSGGNVTAHSCNRHSVC